MVSIQHCERVHHELRTRSWLDYAEELSIPHHLEKETSGNTQHYRYTVNNHSNTLIARKLNNYKKQLRCDLNQTSRMSKELQEGINDVPNKWELDKQFEGVQHVTKSISNVVFSSHNHLVITSKCQTMHILIISIRTTPHKPRKLTDFLQRLRSLSDCPLSHRYPHLIHSDFFLQVSWEIWNLFAQLVYALWITSNHFTLPFMIISSLVISCLNFLSHFYLWSRNVHVSFTELAASI